MQMNKNNLDKGTVGADLSCPPPIYRPRWSFHYPDKKGKQHHWVPTMEKSNVATDRIQLR